MPPQQGKVLWVNLSTREIREEGPGEEVYRALFGGYGLASKFLFERMKPGADPLGEENILCFAAGLLNGTGAWFCGRYMVAAKSPVTGGFGMANSGGSFGPELRRAGYDAIFFTGKSSQPVYFYLEDGKKEIREASHLWGKDAYETEALIKKEAPRAKVACIGQAGEKLSLISGIVNERNRIAARTGMGAVMGSKKLKAVAVVGTKRVEVHSRERLLQLNKEFLAKYKTPLTKLTDEDTLKTKWGRLIPTVGRLTLWSSLLVRIQPLFFRVLMGRYGTPGFAGWSMTSQDSPIKNWSGTHEDFSVREVMKLTDESILKLKKARHSCEACPLGCTNLVASGGRYQLEEVKVEYECLASFGSNCLNSDLETVLKEIDLCNRAGLDGISAGSVVAFACECYEKGLLTEKEIGFPLRWGEGQSHVMLVEKMISREGIGDLLADGVRRASERIPNSKPLAVHAGGVEPAMHDPRQDPGYGIAYQAEPVPGKHLHAVTFIDLEQIDQVLGAEPSPLLYPKSWRFSNWEFHGRRAALASAYFHALSAAGACLFGPLTAGKNWKLLDYVNAATGWDMSREELRRVGERILTIMQAFNYREGIRPEDFRLSKRAAEGCNLIEAQWFFFQELGWDPASGLPSEEKLKELGLEEVRKQLYGK
jgi:aldehyde:ferredoxin oxidoreductase